MGLRAQGWISIMLCNKLAFWSQGVGKVLGRLRYWLLLCFFYGPDMSTHEFEVGISSWQPLV